MLLVIDNNYANAFFKIYCTLLHQSCKLLLTLPFLMLTREACIVTKLWMTRNRNNLNDCKLEALIFL